MREIKVSEVTDVIAKLCMDSCYYLPQEMMDKIRNAAVEEESPLGREILATLIENFELAKKKAVPLCQDTGLTVVFLEIGQEVHFVDGDLYTAIHAGVAKGYTEGYLRKSSVGDPVFDRKNSGDNTPAIIHTKIVPGEKVKIIVCPKGCGSENMGALKMLKPNPCPPITVGVGIGGNMERAAILAKYALTRTVGEHNKDERYAALEDELLELVNKTGVGPSGLGGSTTALAVNVEFTHTHIGGMPCAVNLNCHQARKAEAEI